MVGCAVGVGFATLESSMYALSSILSGDNVFMTNLLRGILAVGGHSAWAAMYGAALVAVKKDRELEFSYIWNKTVLGSFARRSGGGKHFTPLVDGTTMEQVSAAIRLDMEQGTVLTVSVDALQEPGQSQTLEVTCQKKTAIYRDMVTDVDRAWISHAQEATGTDAVSPEEIVTATATEAGTHNTDQACKGCIYRCNISEEWRSGALHHRFKADGINL